MIYDCTPPATPAKHEFVLARAWHKVSHAIHRHHAPALLLCGEPEMDEVVVTAPTPAEPVWPDDVPWDSSGARGSGYYSYPYEVPSGGILPPPVHVPPRGPGGRPLAAPEFSPTGWPAPVTMLMFLLALAAGKKQRVAP